LKGDQNEEKILGFAFCGGFEPHSFGGLLTGPEYKWADRYADRYGQSTGSAPAGQPAGTVKLGYVNWAEGIAMTNLAAAILEDKMGYQVETRMTDVAPLFASLANGGTDAFLDAWLPVTHKSYMEEYGDKLEDLGYNYENAKIGLVGPSYMSIDSIEQLNDAKDDFNGRIVGIDAGAGIMSATEAAIEAYALDYQLMPGSGPTMTAALKKGYRRR
jgi:glycine betaine/proline transport system substrate-binding protein